MAKHKQPSTPWYERRYPADFAPAPTQISGGIDRMVKCFEALRDENPGGWGNGFIKRIKDWGFDKHINGRIACSPFTGTVIGMMFDKSKPDPNGMDFAPTFNGDKNDALPSLFYGFHNTSASETWDVVKPWFKQHGWTTWHPSEGEMDPYSGIGAPLFWNLGYEIDPLDMRRGDLVKIEWAKCTYHPKGGGHSTICWDVHLDETGAVDAFLFVSGNGGFTGDIGVSVSTSPKGLYIEKDGNGKWQKKPPAGQLLFQDRPEYVTKGNWRCIPKGGLSAAEVKKSKTFNPSLPKRISDDEIGSLRVLRFWGFPPPDKNDTSRPRGKTAWANDKFAAKFEQADKLKTEPMPPSQCMGEGRAVTVAVSKVEPVKLPPEKAKMPEEVAKVAAKPVTQKPEDVAPHQHEVEEALGELYRAKWIEKDPGDPKNVNDAQSVEAIKDFQSKMHLKVDGIAGRITRPLLFKAVDDLRSGKSRTLKPTPDVAQPPPKSKPGESKKTPKPKGPPPPPEWLGPVTPVQPKIDHFYWLGNFALANADVAFGIEGDGLDIWNFTTARIVLKNKTTGEQQTVSTTIPFTVAGRGEGSIKLPSSMAVGTVWNATLECSSGGPTIKKASEIDLYVTGRAPDERVAADTSGWPWDERLWPQVMQDIVADLRNTPKPSPPFSAEWCLSTYYVYEPGNFAGPKDPHDKKKKKLRYANGGDVVSVKDRDGNELAKMTRYGLFAADIEATMRVNNRMLNLDQTGRPNQGNSTDFAEFVPENSLWKDVTEQTPWGNGNKIPLIPYRVLAVRNGRDSDKYLKKVYIRALDGLLLSPTGEKHNGICVVGDCGRMDPGKQFDFFKGRHSLPLNIDDGLGEYTNSKKVDLPLSRIVFLDECGPARMWQTTKVARRKKKKA